MSLRAYFGLSPSAANRNIPSQSGGQLGRRQVEVEQNSAHQSVLNAIDFVSKSLETKGLGRISGNRNETTALQKTAKQRVLESKDFKEIHAVVGFIKGEFLNGDLGFNIDENDLDILMSLVNSSKPENKNTAKKFLRELLQDKPVVKEYLQLLKNISLKSNVNLMDVHNLAVVLNPAVIARIDPNKDMAKYMEFSAHLEIAEFMIEHADEIFAEKMEAPQVLAESSSSEASSSASSSSTPPSSPEMLAVDEEDPKGKEKEASAPMSRQEAPEVKSNEIDLDKLVNKDMPVLHKLILLRKLPIIHPDVDKDKAGILFRALLKETMDANPNLVVIFNELIGALSSQLISVRYNDRFLAALEALSNVFPDIEQCFYDKSVLNLLVQNCKK